jgi:hypothetical protein
MDMGEWASMQMPNLYTHLDPGHLSQFADRTLIGADETVTEKLKRNRARLIPANFPQADYSPHRPAAPHDLPPPDAHRIFLPRQASQSCATVETTVVIDRDTLQCSHDVNENQ